MEHVPTILPLNKQNAFMTSIDLQDDYFSLPIAKRHRKYICFIWRGPLYEFQCLCFGLGLAPLYFTKAMKPIVSQLRREGIHCTNYVDDSLYINTSKKQLERHTARAKELLQGLGFTINLEKFSLQPSKQITFSFLDHICYSLELKAYDY